MKDSTKAPPTRSVLTSAEILIKVHKLYKLVNCKAELEVVRSIGAST
jgi:hypothetical protein